MRGRDGLLTWVPLALGLYWVFILTKQRRTVDSIMPTYKAISDLQPTLAAGIQNKYIFEKFMEGRIPIKNSLKRFLGYEKLHSSFVYNKHIFQDIKLREKWKVKTVIKNSLYKQSIKMFTRALRSRSTLPHTSLCQGANECPQLDPDVASGSWSRD